MSYNEIAKIKLLESLIAEAFLNNSINTLKTDEISLQLRTIPNEEKPKFNSIVKQYLELGFSNGYESNIKLEDFSILSDEQKNVIIEEELKEEEIKINQSVTSFKNLFEKVKNELKDYLNNYKGYFITQLVNNPSYNYKLIFFYEKNYHIIPLKGRVNDKFEKTDFDFLEFKSSETISLNTDRNYLCIFLLMSKMNDSEKLEILKSSINNFVGGFEEFYYHTITDKNNSFVCENINRKDAFIDDVDIVLSTYMSNGKISFEEEKIIKKLCSDFKSPLIIYKILSGGFSGSKVLEIRPKKTNNFENDKIYIIKYGLIKDGKIKEEKKNFSNYIKGIKGFLDYTDATYQQTLHYEGILYNYAISESSKSSYSFNDILTKESPFDSLERKNEILTNLFTKNEAFIKWREDHNEIKTAIIKDLYKNFVSKEKIEESLKLIVNDEKDCDLMLQNFEKISKFQIKYKETVCHGDLHTDNFFIDDEKKIYLIDFGFTNKRHAILDYTSLECSLKFKHFPFYLESEEYINIENELLLEDTFNLSHRFTSTKRKEILEYLSMINTIRINSMKDFSNPTVNLEYFISLYLMTIRQIRYPNMNQRYAFHSAKILGEHIVTNYISI